LLITPYFVPSEADRAALVAMAGRGVQVKIVTNSYASTDQRAVHSAYGPMRKELLAGGVQLYELQPDVASDQEAARRAGGDVALHAKAFTVDSRYVFVGSMNLDRRSAKLNTEQGIVVESPALAQAVAQYFATLTQPRNAWRLALEDKNGDGKGRGEILWIGEEKGEPKTRDEEPAVGPMDHTKMILFNLLPIDGML